MRTGRSLERSQTYDSIGVDSPEEIKRILDLPQPRCMCAAMPIGVPT